MSNKSPKYINNSFSAQLDKSRESNKQGMKLLGSREPLKAILFFDTEKLSKSRKVDRLCTVGTSSPNFKIKSPLFCCALFYTENLNP